MILVFASWLHKTQISVALQQQVSWLWPFCETLHFAGLALLLGVAGMFDLRLMGFMRSVPISVVKGFMPWAMAGFALNLLTGIVVLVSEPAQYFGNPTWWLKVAFLVIAGLNALVFETTFGHRAAALPAGVDTPVALKVIAVVSFLSWFGVLWAGRMLPFVGAGVGAGL
jgi:hypothetical protein